MEKLKHAKEVRRFEEEADALGGLGRLKILSLFLEG